MSADIVLIPLGAAGVLELPREVYERHLVAPRAPMPAAAPEKWLNSRQLAELTGIGDVTLEQMAARGDIPCIRAGKALRFLASEVLFSLRSRPRDCVSQARLQASDFNGGRDGRNHRTTER
jgi:hypothetical protein